MYYVLFYGRDFESHPKEYPNGLCYEMTAEEIHGKDLKKLAFLAMAQILDNEKIYDAQIYKSVNWKENEVTNDESILSISRSELGE